MILLACATSCGGAAQPCVRPVPGVTGSFEGYDVITGDDGGIVVDGTGSLPWRVLYASPRNCAGPGEGAGNPLLLELIGNEPVESVDADGCGEETLVVTSDSAAALLAKRIGDLLGSRGLGERVAIHVRCSIRHAAQR